MIAARHSDEAPVAGIAATGATRTRWQAIVVGAGPAGAAAAWRLAAAGIRTLLVDRHDLPRGKVCGCCLSSRALRELHDLSAAALPTAALPLAAVRLAHRGGHTRIPLPAGRVVSRECLDAHLVRQAIAAGCEWLPGLHVTAVEESPCGASITLHGRHATAAEHGPLRIRAEYALIATGLADHIRIAGHDTPGAERLVAAGSRIGIGGVLPATAADLPAGELVMAVGREGYCGIVRLEDGRLDVAAALDRDAVTRATDPADAVARLLASAACSLPRLVPRGDAIRATAFRATPPLTRRAALVAGVARRILRLGDAAGYVEPFTGEGMGWALASARLAAQAIATADGLRVPADAACRYVADHDREFATLHARCRLVAGSLRRPALVAAAVAGARMMPWAARRLVPALLGTVDAGGGR
ncbi:MAG: NAD(P)/FAD-dependent oxidoreductase [Pirellulales bacterium]